LSTAAFRVVVMRATPSPPVLASMPNPRGQRRRSSRPAGVIFRRGRTRSSVVLVRRVDTKAYPTRRLEVGRRERLGSAFAESTPENAYFRRPAHPRELWRSLTRCVGRQHARDSGLRAEAVFTEASKSATPRSA